VACSQHHCVRHRRGVGGDRTTLPSAQVVSSERPIVPRRHDCAGRNPADLDSTVSPTFNVRREAHRFHPMTSPVYRDVLGQLADVGSTSKSCSRGELVHDNPIDLTVVVMSLGSNPLRSRTHRLERIRVLRSPQCAVTCLPRSLSDVVAMVQPRMQSSASSLETCFARFPKRQPTHLILKLSPESPGLTMSSSCAIARCLRDSRYPASRETRGPASKLARRMTWSA